MIIEYFKKQKEKWQKIELIKKLINSIDIDKNQKEIYIDSLSILKTKDIEKLYKQLLKLTIEIKKDTKIYKKIKKTKQKNINSFSIMINNL
jgi:adenosyl cobinamide kinase/adenosyl cobinamide phosphate guanylyltransferase